MIERREKKGEQEGHTVLNYDLLRGLLVKQQMEQTLLCEYVACSTVGGNGIGATWPRLLGWPVGWLANWPSD